MAGITQQGTEVEVGFGSYTLTGYIVEGATVKTSADTEVIKDESNDTKTRLVSDKVKKVTLEMVVKKDTVTPVGGDILTVNSVKYYCEDVDLKHSRTATKITLNLTKEDSMTYT